MPALQFAGNTLAISELRNWFDTADVLAQQVVRSTTDALNGSNTTICPEPSGHVAVR